MIATQPELTLSAARLLKPMVNAGGAKSILDCEDWQLEAVIDQLDGVLNIAGKQSARRELRFSVVCLEEYKRSLRTVFVPPARSDAELCELIFGKPQPLVRAQWVKSRLICHASHFYALCEEKVLRLARGSKPRSGPGGSAVIEWASLVTFIAQRRVS